MARKIGATIALDGAANFKKDVNSCDQALKGFQAELGKTKAEYDGQQNSLEALTKKHSVLEKTLDAARKKQEAVQKALEASRKAQDNAAKAVEKQQSAVDKAQKELDEYRKSTEKTAEGEKALEKALAEAQVELDKANKGYDKAEKSVYSWTTQQHKADTEVINLNNALRDNDKYLDEAQRSADGTAKSIDEYGRKAKSAADSTGETVTALGQLEGLKAVGDVMGSFAAKMSELSEAAVNAAKAIDEGYDTIITKTGATGDALAKFTEIADDIYGRLPEEMQTIAAAIGEVNTRFGLQDDELEELSEQFVKFAKINGVDVSGSVDKVQKALTAFGRPASDAADILDALTKAGQQSGIGMDTLESGLINNAAALQEMGLSLEDSVKFIGQLEKSGADTNTVLSGMSKALKTATKDGKSVNTALAEMEKTIRDGKGGMDGLTASYELFGKKGDVVYNAVKNGSLSFRNLKDSVQDFAGTVDRTYDATLDAWDKWEVATNNLKGAVSDLTQDGLEALTPAIEKATGLAKDFRSNLQKLPEPVRKVASATMLVAGEIGKALPKVISMGAQLAQLKTASALAGQSLGGGGGLASSLSAFAGSAVGIGAITLGAAAGIGLITGAVINATGVLDGLDSRIGDVAGAADAMSKTLADAQSNLSQAMESAKSAVQTSEATFGVASGLIDELEQLANKTERTKEEQAKMEQIVGMLNSQFPTLKATINATTGELEMSTQAIRDFINEAKNAAMIEAYNNAIREGYNAIFEAQTKVYDAEKKLEEVGTIQAGIQQQIDSTTAAMQANREVAQRLSDQLVNDTYSQDTVNAIERLDQSYALQVQKLGELQDELTYTNQTYADAQNELNGFKTEVASAEGDIAKYNDILSQMQESVAGVGDAAAEAGANVDEGLVKGIEGGMAGAEDAAGGMGTNVIKSLKNTLGVRSPSVYAADAGRNVALGLANGENQMRAVVAASAMSLAAAGNVAAYMGAYIAAAQMAGIQVAQAFAGGISMGRGLVGGAMGGLTGRPVTTNGFNGSPITQNNSFTINGAAGQSVNAIADQVSRIINRQVNSLRSARG